MPDLYIGAMSGTSLDGLDLAICDLNSQSPVLHTKLFEFPSLLKQSLFDLSHQTTITFNNLYQTEQNYSDFCAHSINSLLKELKLSPSEIKAIGMHGQTVRHHPELSPGYTVQLANLSHISAHTGITTVGDFRRKDLALGGQGAPLVPPFHNAYFGSKTETRVIANIGGISNISILKPKASPVGYDTGPGNALLDYWFSKHNSGDYDLNGDWAKQGQVNTTLLNQLLSVEYFTLSAPKSTGRELFNPEWLHNELDEFHQHNPIITSTADIQATLTELTAKTLADEISTQAKEAGSVYVCGGGWKNSHLINRLSYHLGNKIKVASTTELGIESDWIEACAFAWFAKNTLERKDCMQSSATGATRDAILGGIYYP